VIEALIGHMKADGLMGRNWLEGTMSDAIHAILCAAGQNLRFLLRAISTFLHLSPRGILECSQPLQSLQPDLPHDHPADALRLCTR